MATDIRHDFDVVTARHGETTDEARAPGEDRRPELSAESLDTRMRVGLLLLTLLAAALTVVTMVAVFVWPEGIFHAGTWGAALIGGIVVLVWMLQIVFGALLENNRAISGPAHRGWIAAFALTGPVGLLFYWWLHVWPATYLPHRDALPTEERRARAE